MRPARAVRCRETAAALSLAAVHLSACAAMRLECFPRFLSFSPAQCLLISLLVTLACRAAFFLRSRHGNPLFAFLRLLGGGFYLHAFAHAAALLLPLPHAYYAGLAAGALLMLPQRLIPYKVRLCGAGLPALLWIGLCIVGSSAAAHTPAPVQWRPFYAVFAALLPLACALPVCEHSDHACRLCAGTGAAAGFFYLLENLLLPAPLLTALCAQGANGFAVLAASLAAFSFTALCAMTCDEA